VKIFCWSSENDEDVRLQAQLLRQLHVRPWRNQVDIVTYSNIEGGMIAQEELLRHLATANIVLPLISPDFPWNSEAEQLLAQRYHNNEVLVLCILLRHIDLPAENTTIFFAYVPNVFPGRDRPIRGGGFSNEDDALKFVTGHLDLHIRQHLQIQIRDNTKQLFIDQIETLIANKNYEEALVACERALNSGSREAKIYSYMGKAYIELGKFPQAIQAYQRAIDAGDQNVQTYQGKGDAHSAINEPQLAMEAYTRALELAPNDFDLWRKKGSLLNKKGSFEEAWQVYEQAISFSPPNKHVYYKEQADILLELQRYQDAITAYSEAIRLVESYKAAYEGRATACEKLAKQLLRQAKEDRQKARKL
jgi:tetratricopeptide (TPR) repeat protein